MKNKAGEEIARSLMLEILYDNGYIDRWHTEKSQVSEKWLKRIIPIADKFFNDHPELLTNEHIENIGLGGIMGDPDEDLDVIYKDYPDISSLRDILNEYYDDCCGIY